MTLTHVLLTGASGYVGGRLLHRLEQRADLKLRCLARRPESVHPLAATKVEILKGDILDEGSLAAAMAGVQHAYFLVHALGSSRGFEDLEREGARNFAQAAKSAGVERILYLGGLGQGDNLSLHLKTRHEVGEILAASGIPTIEFRASIIIGSGSISFELLRSLTEKLPVMLTPRWLNSLAQPIAIEDVLDYLIAALDSPLKSSVIYEIGGPEQVSYLGLMKEYARQRALSRWFIPVPVLSPYFSSLWLGLVTPVYARVGRKLIDSLRHDTVVSNDAALQAFEVRPMSYQRAIARALTNEDREVAETRWSDAESAARGPRYWGGQRFGSRIVDSRSLTLQLSPRQAFFPIARIGGKRGWYYADFLWRLRGLIDLLIGGVGLRRGRIHPSIIRPGDPIDCWRVESFVPEELLRLRAEMKIPGRAWLQFEVKPIEPGWVSITQTALFDPLGLWGLVYWYALYPIHALIFSGMLRGLAKAAQAQEQQKA